MSCFAICITTPSFMYSGFSPGEIGPINAMVWSFESQCRCLFASSLKLTDQETKVDYIFYSLMYRVIVVVREYRETTRYALKTVLNSIGKDLSNREKTCQSCFRFSKVIPQLPIDGVLVFSYKLHNISKFNRFTVDVGGHVNNSINHLF